MQKEVTKKLSSVWDRLNTSAAATEESDGKSAASPLSVVCRMLGSLTSTSEGFVMVKDSKLTATVLNKLRDLTINQNTLSEVRSSR